MQDKQSNIITMQQLPGSNELEQSQEVSSTRSASTGDANGIRDIEIQASQLFDYIDRLNTFAVRPYNHFAKNETQRPRQLTETYQTELASLSKQLEQSKAALQERNVAYAVLQEKTKTQLAEMEKRLLEKQVQLGHREEELRTLTTDISAFIKRQHHPQESERPGDSQAGRLNSESLTREIETLKSQVTKRDEIIQAKNDALRIVENEFRLKIQELENALRESSNRLEQQEVVLKQKESLIQATAAKEAEVGKLIKRLSTECDNLNKQLQEKNRRFAQIEKENVQSSSNVGAWRQVVGRLQEDPT
ncbi:MAG: hypothetical protein ACM3SP_10745 [Chloroflexota bacterium]